MLENEVQSGALNKRQESFSAKVWRVGLVIVISLVIDGMESNPAPQVEQAD
jgi:hypothetical protein